MSEKETSAENQSVESEVAGDEAVEEAKKRAILGSDLASDDPKEEAETNHVDDEDVEKGSSENCNIDKEDELLRGDDSKDEDRLEDSKEEDNVEDSKEDDKAEGGGQPGEGGQEDDGRDSLIFDMERSPQAPSSPQSSPPPSKKSSTVEPSPSQGQSQAQSQSQDKSQSHETSQSPEQAQEVDPSKQIYHVKWIGWHDTRCPIILQNVNGPCPLISLTNVLLLSGKMSLNEGTEVISSDFLNEYIANLLLTQESSSSNTAMRISDAIGILPTLSRGLDVNVQFYAVDAFEFTKEIEVFELLKVPLYHGWLVDPQEEAVANAVGRLSYNQLVEKVINDQTSNDDEKVSKAIAAQKFLDETMSQLTYHGLCELSAKMKEGELAVFFRNNHFSTIYKLKTELFLLATDQGYLKESRHVWETLSNIDGDGHFVDDKFVTAPPKEESAAGAALSDEPLTPEQQLDQDHLLALSLAEEDKQFNERAAKWEKFKAGGEGGSHSTMSDEELAKELQDEMDREAAAEESAAQTQQQGQRPIQQPTAPPRQHQLQQQHQQQQPLPSTSRQPAAHPGVAPTRDRDRQRSGNKNCIIL